MDRRIEEFAKPIGFDAGKRAIDAYKKERGHEFDPAWEAPMLYSSGCTAARVAHAFATKWIVPLKRRARITGFAALASLALLLAAVAYSWSLMDFSTFSRFLVAFVPGIAALVFSIAKVYKTWAEAKKTLAEARSIERSAPQSSD